MKKNILILALTIIFLISGCTKEEEQVVQTSPTIGYIDEEEQLKEKDILQDHDNNVNIDDYMVYVKEQSDIIKSSLTYDELTQTDMNLKSQELYELWDEALNYLWDELKNNLSEEDFSKLLDEQREWIAKKENALEEVGKEFEGGSIYSLIVNDEAARLTEERTDELYKILKSLK